MNAGFLCWPKNFSLTWDYWQCSYIGKIYLRYSHTMGIPPFDSILSSSALQLAIHALGYTLGSQSIGARLSGVIHAYSRLVSWSRSLLGATSCLCEHNQDDRSISSLVGVLQDAFLALVWHMHTLSDPRVYSHKSTVRRADHSMHPKTFDSNLGQDNQECKDDYVFHSNDVYVQSIVSKSFKMHFLKNVWSKHQNCLRQRCSENVEGIVCLGTTDGNRRLKNMW